MEIINQDIEKLGLKYEVKFFSSDVPKIRCDPQSQKHEIGIPYYATLYSVRHELCHAYLAENVHPNFAGSRVSPDSNPTDLERKCKLLGWFDNAVVDVWVNDVFYDHWPAELDSHKRIFLEDTVRFLGEGDYFRFTLPLVPLGLGSALADRRRHDMPEVDISSVFAYLRHCGGEIIPQIGLIARELKKLPALPRDETNAIKLYESCVTGLMGKLEIDFTPRLEPAEGKYAWRL